MILAYSMAGVNKTDGNSPKNNMKWLKNLFGSSDQPTGNQTKLEPEIAANETATRKHGMKLDWEGLFVPYKLGRLDLTVQVGERDEIFRIDQLIKNYEEKP